MTHTPLERAYAYAAQMQRDASTPPLRRHIRRGELRQIVPLSDTTIYEMEQRNEFPRRIVLMPRVVVWDLEEVEVWLEQRKRDTLTGRTRAAVPQGVRRRNRQLVRHA